MAPQQHRQQDDWSYVSYRKPPPRQYDRPPKQQRNRKFCVCIDPECKDWYWADKIDQTKLLCRSNHPWQLEHVPSKWLHFMPNYVPEQKAKEDAATDHFDISSDAGKNPPDTNQKQKQDRLQFLQEMAEKCKDQNQLPTPGMEEEIAELRQQLLPKENKAPELPSTASLKRKEQKSLLERNSSRKEVENSLARRKELESQIEENIRVHAIYEAKEREKTEIHRRDLETYTKRNDEDNAQREKEKAKEKQDPGKGIAEKTEENAKAKEIEDLRAEIAKVTQINAQLVERLNVLSTSNTIQAQERGEEEDQPMEDGSEDEEEEDDDKSDKSAAAAAEQEGKRRKVKAKNKNKNKGK